MRVQLRLGRIPDQLIKRDREANAERESKHSKSHPLRAGSNRAGQSSCAPFMFRDVSRKFQVQGSRFKSSKFTPSPLTRISQFKSDIPLPLLLGRAAGGASGNTKATGPG